MKANELRKGNIVYNAYEGGNEKLSAYQIAQIELMNNGGHVADYYHTLKYIPLTEDWFLKFAIETNYHKSSFRGVYYNFMIDGILYYYFTDTNTIEKQGSHMTYKYVHSFQNLYFALTQEELKIK